MKATSRMRTSPGQDEPSLDSPPAPRENTAAGPGGEGQMDVDPEARRRMRGKTRPISLEQPTSSPVNASPDAAPQEAEREIMMAREEESMNLFHQSPQLPKTKSQH